ncbi:hypothetical protein BDR26DRAFT_946429 [Obelidium mucronatum]|nr:hypothetical protein BDR26DRAFT_946429 [Obelidium mucronatum]
MGKSLSKASSKFGRDASQVECVKARKGNSKQKALASFTQEVTLAAIFESNSDSFHGAQEKTYVGRVLEILCEAAKKLQHTVFPRGLPPQY